MRFWGILGDFRMDIVIKPAIILNMNGTVGAVQVK